MKISCGVCRSELDFDDSVLHEQNVGVVNQFHKVHEPCRSNEMERMLNEAQARVRELEAIIRALPVQAGV